MMMYSPAKRVLLTTLILFTFTLSACSDETSPNTDVTCNAGERHNPITNLCEPNRTENPLPQSDAGTPSDTQDSENNDATPTQGEENDVQSGSDQDDASLPEQDSESDVHDNHPINCYDIAEGYADVSTTDIVCEFYAHTASALYLVDPFRKTAKEVMSLPGDAFDIDMHTNGTLYLVADNILSSLAPDTTQWVEEGRISVGNPNGLCLDMGGTAFITSSSNLYSFDLDNKRLSSPIGGDKALDPYSSSGDCVINKGNVLYMSSSSRSGGADDLVQIDSANGETTKIGNIGYSGVYALTSAWGRLYGLTGAGELLEISSETGRGQLIHRFPGKIWNGAASTPQR